MAGAGYRWLAGVSGGVWRLFCCFVGAGFGGGR